MRDALPDLRLIPIDADGSVQGFDAPLSEMVTHVLEATGQLYAAVGFEEPWIGYLAVSDGVPVGTCGFKSPPQQGRVEIAYFTFPDFEGRGIASAMATRLVAMTLEHRPTLVIAAQTLPERNASHRVLEKQGFRHTATLDHAEDGTVWEWHWQGNQPSDPHANPAEGA